MEIYNFEKFEKSNNAGRKSIKALSVSGQKVNLFQAYTRTFSDIMYCEIWYDKKKKVVGVRPSMAKVGFLAYGRNQKQNTITLRSISFLSIPDGIYRYKETTNEKIDVFLYEEKSND